MRLPVVTASAATRRASGTVVREWHRLACSASGTSGAYKSLATPSAEVVHGATARARGAQLDRRRRR